MNFGGFLVLAGGLLVLCALLARFSFATWRVTEIEKTTSNATDSKTSNIVEAPPQSRGWSMHDRQGLQAFLGSPSGKRFLERLRATEYALAVAGAKDVMHTAHSAGVTVGYGDCIKHIESLSYTSDAQEEKTNDSGGQGEARPIEREAAEWAARMSP